MREASYTLLSRALCCSFASVAFSHVKRFFLPLEKAPETKDLSAENCNRLVFLLEWKRVAFVHIIQKWIFRMTHAKREKALYTLYIE